MPAAAPRSVEKCSGREASAGFCRRPPNRLILKEASHSLETRAVGDFQDGPVQADCDKLPIIMPLTSGDLDEIMRLERQCFRDPWTRRMYTADLTENEMATYLAARWPVAAGQQQTAAGDQPARVDAQRAAIVAYGGFWLMVDEAHIATVATHPRWRGCGLGIWLMLALLDAAMARGATISTLEVRAGNIAAQRMYDKLGYALAGVRSHYYRDGEDGWIMTTPPLKSPAMQERLRCARAEAITRLKRCCDLLRTTQPEPISERPAP
ncbi:MAG: GNAT family N-acetyltransferase [Chloroflexi bacterium]|nr:GNAT family N-acetyltransferase [Chloroflexota bacterium]